MTGREEGPGYTDGGSARRRLARVVVVGMGSEWRRDDGVGMRVATLVAGNADGDAFANCQVVTQLGDPVDLLSHWDGADLAVVVDATRSGLAPGTVSLIELDQEGSELGIETRGEQGAGARTSWVAVAASLSVELARPRARERAAPGSCGRSRPGQGGDLRHRG